MKPPKTSQMYEFASDLVNKEPKIRHYLKVVSYLEWLRRSNSKQLVDWLNDLYPGFSLALSHQCPRVKQ